MYYLNCFIIYSLLGFIMESVVYKIHYSNQHSGVLLGPYTFVYGLGGILIILINNFIHISNPFISIFILFIIFTITCTIVEYLIGNLIHNFFHIDKWNYTNHKYHFGKYICLDLALTWGILSLLIIYLFKPFLDQVILLIPKNITIIIIIIMIIDTIYNLYKTKKPKI